jgi:hypothetical protein
MQVEQPIRAAVELPGVPAHATIGDEAHANY